mmetsp:Transcript_11146/g.27272  ORF Transcript_11146/g.27272 Transcript_11146/m.27272 type:complete len:221 (-) Transcript_11146:293-955(-)
MPRTVAPPASRITHSLPLPTSSTVPASTTAVAPGASSPSEIKPRQEDEPPSRLKGSTLSALTVRCARCCRRISWEARSCAIISSGSKIHINAWSAFPPHLFSICSMKLRSVDSPMDRMLSTTAGSIGISCSICCAPPPAAGAGGAGACVVDAEVVAEVAASGIAMSPDVCGVGLLAWLFVFPPALAEVVGAAAAVLADAGTATPFLRMTTTFPEQPGTIP